MSDDDVARGHLRLLAAVQPYPDREMTEDERAAVRGILAAFDAARVAAEDVLPGRAAYAYRAGVLEFLLDAFRRELARLAGVR